MTMASIAASCEPCDDGRQFLADLAAERVDRRVVDLHTAMPSMFVTETCFICSTWALEDL